MRNAHKILSKVTEGFFKKIEKIISRDRLCVFNKSDIDSVVRILSAATLLTIFQRTKPKTAIVTPLLFSSNKEKQQQQQQQQKGLTKKMKTIIVIIKSGAIIVNLTVLESLTFLCVY